ncbi:MAG: hypothetical protein AB7N71_01110 [Phycisphaerae bacterium]
MRMRALIAYIILAIAPHAFGQVIETEVKRVGFPSSTMSGLITRDGQWVPIIVEMRLPGSGIFEGAIRIVSRDRDGDFVEYMRAPVLLNPEAGKKRFWAYATFDRHRLPPSGYQVDILDSQGAVIAKQDLQPFDVVRNDSAIVLDISQRQVSKLRMLEDRQAELDSLTFSSQKFTLSHVISFMSAEDLPDRWFGLESIDTIVWDLPDPQQITSNQLEAIVEWVRRGGKLVVGIGDAWPRIRDSDLADILPVGGDGALLEAKQLRNFSAAYVRGENEQSPVVKEYATPIAVADVTATRGATVTFRDQVFPGAKPIDLISMKMVGSGRVIAVAASLREMTTLRVDESFFNELFDLAERSDAYNKRGVDRFSNMISTATGAGPYNLFDRAVATINFSGKRQLFVLAALAFVAIYGLVATFGSWTYLNRLKKTGMSWTIFAGIAAVASMLGLFAVGATAQFRTGVHAAYVVDLPVDLDGAPATAWGWFGYGSALRQSFSFSLGGRDSYVRPLSMAGTPPSTYATSSRYQSDPIEGTLENVSIRATLKQFEGHWSGNLEGTITGQLIADRGTGQLTAASWLRNDLPYAIRGGYILYVDPRSQAGPLGMLDRPTSGDHWMYDDAPASLNVVSFALPAIGRGDKIDSTAFTKQLNEIESELVKWESRDLSIRSKILRPDLVTLRDLQHYWAHNVFNPPIGTSATTMPESATSLLLASTLSLFRSADDRDKFDSVGRMVDPHGLPPLDVGHWLQRGKAVLFLYVDVPADIPLLRNGAPLRAKNGFAIYRVRLPLQYAGTPPPEGELFKGLSD